MKAFFFSSFFLGTTEIISQMLEKVEGSQGKL